MTVSSKTNSAGRKEWIDLIGQPCRTSDDHELGRLEAISADFIVIRKVYLTIHFHYYYIPYERVRGWDGSSIWLRISKTQVEKDYERHKAPDPKQYYVKDGGVNQISTYPQVILIPSQSQQQVFTAADQRLTPIHKCDLCGVSFNTDDELSSHVKIEHA